MVESTLIKGGLVVTGDSQGRVIPGGFVRIEGNRISEVGKGIPRLKSDETIDASKNVIIPGLLTAHTHLYGILLRGATLGIEPPTDFAQVLQRVWWPLDEALTLDDARASSLAASADMLRNGSTFYADTYSGPNSIDGVLDGISDAASKVGIRSMLAFEITERNSPQEAERGLQENVRFAQRCFKEKGLSSAMMSLHASFTVSDELITRAVTRASGLEIPVTIHTSEGLVDVYHNLEKHGERTVERLNRLGALKRRTVLAHCVHVTAREIEMMARQGVGVAHNPMSNMLNAVGTSPVPDMLARRIPVGLGNDGWIYDPFENMRCALTVHRLAAWNPSVMTAEQVFRMATIDGARCYGLERELGSIEAGKMADLVFLGVSRVPTPLDGNSVIGHLVNTFGGRDVERVIVDGKTVVDHGRLSLISDEEVAGRCQKTTQDLWSRLSKRSTKKQ